MKKLILCLLAISCCFADLSPKNKVIYQKVWDFYKLREIEKAIELMNQTVEDKSISNVDKLHFLMTRSVLDQKNRDKALDEVKKLIHENTDCAIEYQFYYLD